MTAKEFITDPERIETIMNICDNLFFKPKSLKSSTPELLSREEIIGDLKAKLGDSFASFYPQKATHCRQSIDNTKIGFAYQILGSKNSITNNLQSLSNYQRLYAYAKQQGLYSGDFAHMEGFMSELFTRDKQTFYAIVDGAKSVKLDYEFSDDPETEKQCKTLNQYCMMFVVYLFEEKTGLDFDNASVEEKLQFMESLKTDKQMESFKMGLDPLIERNNPHTYDETDNGIFKKLTYLDHFKENSTCGGAAGGDDDQTYVIFGIDSDDAIVFHEFDHACKKKSFNASTQALNADDLERLGYRSFTEIMTDIDGEEVAKQYRLIFGEDFLLKPANTGNSRYRIMEQFVRKIVDSDFFEVVKYAGFESLDSINILLSHSHNIKNLMSALHTIDIASISAIKEIKSLGLIPDDLKPGSVGFSKYLYRAGEKLAKENNYSPEFSVSTPCLLLLRAIKDAYKAQEAVIQDVMTASNEASQPI